MAYDGLNWQTIHLPFRAGLAQKTDDRARPQPFLDICKDVEFDESGALRQRLPFALMGAGAIFGGGSLANGRKLAIVNNELCVFTSTGMYSWNAQLSKFVLRSTHLAVATDERPAFATIGDQIEGDRAELSGTVVVAWTEGTQVYAAALDKTTGSVLVTPTAVSTAIGRPRLVALATKILLFVEATTTLLTVRAIDPAAPGTAIAGAGTTVLATDFNLMYDVVKVDGQDLAVGATRRVTTTSYTAFTVTAGLVVTTSTKARVCDAAIAVSSTPGGGTQIQVIRSNAGNIQGDVLTTSTLADVTTGQAVGTAATAVVNQIAACHRSVQDSGAYRCYVFWTAAQTATNPSWRTKFNYVDTGGTIGTQADFKVTLAVASRAFDYAGSVYVWLTFGNNSQTSTTSAPFATTPVALQNTYFLFRDDQTLHAKASPANGGGFPASDGHLPGVALTGTGEYTWCGTQKRRIPVADGTVGFAARTPIDIAATFDSDSARRTARIGRTLYVAGGEILQYDGVRLVEVGFHIAPWFINIIEAAAGGSVADGTYSYKETLRYQNAQNEIDLSTTAAIATIAMTADSLSILEHSELVATHKTAVPPSLEVWRTAMNPDKDSPFFLVSTLDPTDLTNPNRYIPNDHTATLAPVFNDFLADATVTLAQNDHEVGDILEYLAPPAAKIIIATDRRVFLAGVAGDPDRVWYSRYRKSNEVASFHDGLPVEVPRDGGAITALAIHQETLVVFRETAIYALPGDGLNNLGQGTNYGPARTLSLDVGAVSHEAVALTPLGTVFKSSKGWYLLTPGFGLQYIGDKVSDYDSETVVAVTVVETQHQVRILSSSRLLVWDYAAATAESPIGQWGEWSITGGLDAVMWNGTYVYLTSTGPRQQQSSYSTADYGYDVETAWIKLADLQGAAACRRLQTLGEVRSTHYLRHRVAYNYKQTESTPDYVDDKSWLVSPTTVGGPLQVKHGTRRVRCEAIKLRLTAQAATTVVTDLIDIGGFDVDVDLISGFVWGATLAGVAPRTISIFFEFDASATEATIDLRDNYFGDDENLGAGFVWTYQQGNCGIRVIGNNTTAVVSYLALEAALGASTLVQVSVSDAAHVAAPNINMSAMDFVLVQGEFLSASPTGECAKLTGLGLEVGIERGLFNRLPAAQRQ